MIEKSEVSKPGVLVPDDEYEIEVRKVDEHSFEITLGNDPAHRALGVGQTQRHDDSARTLAMALDGTLNAIDEEIRKLETMLLGPVGISGESGRTPYQFTIRIKDEHKLRVIEQCARTSGIDQLETMRRLTTLALRLIIFESRPPGDPEVHPMLESSPKTVH